MGREEYRKALKLGKKDYQTRLLRGEKPILQVLDDILPNRSSYSESSIGLVQIPIDQIAGSLPQNGKACLTPMWRRESANRSRLMNICINFMWWKEISE